MVRRWHFEYLKRSVITRSERETESERERKREKQKREEKRERRGETGETRVENSETRREGTQNEANGVNLPGCRGSSLLSPPSLSLSLSLSLSSRAPHPLRTPCTLSFLSFCYVEPAAFPAIRSHPASFSSPKIELQEVERQRMRPDYSATGCRLLSRVRNNAGKRSLR